MITLDMLKVLGDGLIMSVLLLITAYLLAISLGFTVAALMLFVPKPLARALQGFVEVFRAVPLLTQLFIIYFGLPSVGIMFDPFTAAMLGLGLNGAAYAAEIFRAGIKAVPHGQTEAAQVVGLRRLQVLIYIIGPQAFRLVLAPLTNLAVQILKNTAVASAVAAPEIIFKARILVAETYLSPQIYGAVCVFYLLVTTPMVIYATRLERALKASNQRT